jgi:hypothetical protein
MIDPDEALANLDYLRESAADMERLEKDARAALRRAKLKQALAIERMGKVNDPDSKVPVTLRKEISWADPEVQEGFKEADETDAHLIGVNAKRAAAKDTLILHMSMVKDRM